MTKITEKQLIDSLKQLKEIKPNKEWAVLLKSKIIAEKRAEVEFIPATSIGFMDTLKSLGNEAKQILGIIFAAPGEVLNIASDCSPFQILFPAPDDILDTIDNDSVCHARMAIKKYMKEIGFSQDEIRYGINEIKSTFIQ